MSMPFTAASRLLAARVRKLIHALAALPRRRKGRLLAEQLQRPQVVERQLEEQVRQFQEVRANTARTESRAHRVLLLMDDPVCRTDMTAVLRQEGFTVQTADGTAGLHTLTSLLSAGHPVDVVLLDLGTASLTGFEILRRIRERHTPAELPVLLLTDRDSLEEAATGFWLGANDTVGLPCVSSELTARVRNLIQMRQWIDRTVASELAFLQAQIKPHFIFNTLSAVAARCLRSPEEARDLLLDFSDYLRESFFFETKNGLTRLQRELRLVQLYLTIEQARFRPRLTVKYDIDPTVDCTLPVLSIQPIVENAVRHGLMPRAEGGEVRISVRREAGQAVILVADNGLGMTAEQCGRICADDVSAGASANTSASAFANVSAGAAGDERLKVGLSNTHRRLLALYGRGLTISSAPGEGTCVRFSVPLAQPEACE